MCTASKFNDDHDDDDDFDTGDDGDQGTLTWHWGLIDSLSHNSKTKEATKKSNILFTRNHVFIVDGDGGDVETTEECFIKNGRKLFTCFSSIF